jgi:hypothetical protein
VSYWEATGRSDDWFTPKFVFDALGCKFDLDVAAPEAGTRHVPAGRWLHASSLDLDWHGFVWMNPPFGGRYGLCPWLDKFFAHGDGIALTPDRTSAAWWQSACRRADATLFVAGKIRFERPDGSEGKQPSNGTTLFAAGLRGVAALDLAHDNGLGVLLEEWRKSQ